MAEQGKHIPKVTFLMTIPGIDYYSAMIIFAGLDHVNRAMFLENEVFLASTVINAVEGYF